MAVPCAETDMIQKILLPKLGQTMEEATMVKSHRTDGEWL